MRWLRMLAPLVLCAGAAYAAPAQAQTSAATAAEAEVRALERAWLDAYERRDAAAMTRIVADDFIITYPDGRTVDKAGTLREIGGPGRPGAGPRFRTEQVRARSYGDTVILDGVLLTESGQAGGPPPRRNRYTDTWIRRGGRWQVVASHLSAPPER